MAVGHELEIPKVKDGGNQLTSLSDVTFGETGILQCVLEVLKPDSVIIAPALSRVSRSLAEVTVRHLVCQMKVLALFSRGAGDEVVKNVEVPLSRWGCRDTVPFEVIIQGLDSVRAAAFGIFSETRRGDLRASPKLSRTNSAVGTWVTDFEPLPGLLALSSSEAPIVSRPFSGFPPRNSLPKFRDHVRSVVENVRRCTSEKALVLNNASHVAAGGVKTTGESQGESDVGMSGYILPRSGWPQSKKSRDWPAQQLWLQERYRSSLVDQIWVGCRLAVGSIIKGRLG